MRRLSKWERHLARIAQAETDPGTRVDKRNREELREADEQDAHYRRNRFLRQQRRRRTK